MINKREEVRRSVSGKTTKGFALPLFAAGLVCASAAFSQEVSLRSSDGTINVSGELVEFSDDFYVIETDLGPLRVSSRLVFCEGEACPTVAIDQTDMLKIAGSETVNQVLLPLLVSGFAEAQDAEADVSLQGGARIARIIGDQGFGEEIGAISLVTRRPEIGFEALLGKEVEIAVTNRRITRDEARNFAGTLGERMVDPSSEQVVALDSVAIIVHPDNPARNVSLEDLGKIYAGEIVNWSELGGSDMPIQVVRHANNFGADVSFLENLNENLSQAIVVEGDTEASITVSRNPAAIGYVSLPSQRGNKALEITTSCGISHAPSSFTTKTEEYPLVRRVYVYNRGSEEDADKSAFWNFITSQAADSLVAKSGFVDLGMERVSLASLSGDIAVISQQDSDPFVQDQAAQYLTASEGWDRLSITFRFRTASSQLDEKARRDIERLTSYLSQLDGDVSLAIVGFTDSDGPETTNLVLGEERALAIQETLAESLSAANVSLDLKAMSFGEFAPVACNDTSDGKSINRRVEVWIKS